MAVLAGDAETTEEEGAQVEAGPCASEPALGVSVTSSYLKPSGLRLPSNPMIRAARVHWTQALALVTQKPSVSTSCENVSLGSNLQIHSVVRDSRLPPDTVKCRLADSSMIPRRLLKQNSGGRGRWTHGSSQAMHVLRQRGLQTAEIRGKQET